LLYLNIVQLSNITGALMLMPFSAFGMFI